MSIMNSKIKTISNPNPAWIYNAKEEGNYDIGGIVSRMAKYFQIPIVTILNYAEIYDLKQLTFGEFKHIIEGNKNLKKTTPEDEIEVCRDLDSWIISRFFRNEGRLSVYAFSSLLNIENAVNSYIYETKNGLSKAEKDIWAVHIKTSLSLPAGFKNKNIPEKTQNILDKQKRKQKKRYASFLIMKTTSSNEFS